jgi:tetratricopeptide (TPR) repeat protein
MSDKQQVKALIQSQRWIEAKALCTKVCQADRNDAETWYMLGAINGQLGAFDEAEACCRRVIGIRPDVPMAHFNLGIALQRQAKSGDAVKSFRQAIRLNPGFAEAHNELGVALQSSGQLDDAVAHYHKALSLKPAYAEAHYNLAVAQRELGKHEEAIASCREALRLRPDLAEAHNALGFLLKAQGKLEEATACFQRAISLRPNDAKAHGQLGEISASQKKFSEAIVHYRRAVAANPDDAISWNALGGTLLDRAASQDDFTEAEKCYRRAISCRPDTPEFHANLAVLLREHGRYDEAFTCYQRALESKPGYPEAVAGLAQIYEYRGDFDRGYALLRPLIESGTDNSTVALAYAAVSRHVDKRVEAAEFLERLVQQQMKSSYELRSMYFALGKLYDAMREYDKAFDRYQQANSLGTARFDIKQNEQAFDDLIRIFSAENLARWPRAANRSGLPVFIVGMPRSGTTLVEQILASHPEVYGAGELPDIHRIVVTLPTTLGSSAPFPQCVADISQKHVDEITERHLATLRGFSGTAGWVTDKMPHNFLALGLIDMLFPGARVIHCMRDPIDTCLSIYFLPFNPSHPYADDLTHLGIYYRQYQRLMAHWRSVLRIPILDVQYEELVNNQEQVSRKMVEFCGLEWNEQCLRFHESGRTVSTHSYDQVRRPIYKKSVARWKNYEKHLTPLIEALGNFG